MNLNRNTTEKTLLQALFIAICAATVGRAGMAYLPLTGPAPLRISVAQKPTAPTAPVLIAAPAVVNTNQLDLCVDHPGYTNSTATANPGLFPLPAVKLGAGGVLNQTSGAGVFNLATPDFRAITPQMLAAYF